MKIIKKIMVLTFSTFIFFSCGKDSKEEPIITPPTSDEVNINEPNTEVKNDNENINPTPAPKPKLPKVMEVVSTTEKKQTEYSDYVINIPQIINLDTEDIEYFNLTMKENMRNIIDNMATSKEDGEYESADMNYQVKNNNFNVMSIILTTNLYPNGGAHPIHEIDAYNLNKKTGTLITNDKLLEDDDVDYFNMLINDQISNKKPIYNTNGEECFLFNDIEANVKDAIIYFEGDNIVFVFKEYYMAPYSSGMPMFKFNKDNIKKNIHLN